MIKISPHNKIEMFRIASRGTVLFALPHANRMRMNYVDHHLLVYPFFFCLLFWAGVIEKLQGEISGTSDQTFFVD